MFERIARIYYRIREIIGYLFFGVLTTLVNYAVYILFTDSMGINYLVSNAAAWIIAVLFAYITNKLFVFRARSPDFRHLVIECFGFFLCRGLSGGADMLCMYLLVDIAAINDKIAKVLVNIIVIVLNYFFSKLIVFRKSKKECADEENNIREG